MGAAVCVLLCVFVCVCVWMCVWYFKSALMRIDLLAPTLHCPFLHPLSSPANNLATIRRHWVHFAWMLLLLLLVENRKKKNILKFNLSSWTEIKLHTSTFGAHVLPCPTPSCPGKAIEQRHRTDSTRSNNNWRVRSIVIWLSSEATSKWQNTRTAKRISHWNGIVQWHLKTV